MSDSLPVSRLVESLNSRFLSLQVRVGMSIGHPPGEEPHKPDMKKSEDNVTMEERQEAKRRIEGSLAPETGGTGLMSGMGAANMQ